MIIVYDFKIVLELFTNNADMILNQWLKAFFKNERSRPRIHEWTMEGNHGPKGLVQLKPNSVESMRPTYIFP